MPPTAGQDLERLDTVLDRMDGLLEAVDAMAPADRDVVIELLDTVDDVHRLALIRLGERLGPALVEELRDAHPAIAWLWEAYGVGLDARTVAVRAVDAVRPYLESHGGDVEVLEVRGGVVRVRMTGACRGCTSSAVTLQEGVERALRSGFPDFERLEVEEDPDAVPHPPPGGGEVLLQIQPRPPA
jgi:Fe-S cluster biogenesis protein NfuA